MEAVFPQLDLRAQFCLFNDIRYKALCYQDSPDWALVVFLLIFLHVVPDLFESIETRFHRLEFDDYGFFLCVKRFNVGPAFAGPDSPFLSSITGF